MNPGIANCFAGFNSPTKTSITRMFHSGAQFEWEYLGTGGQWLVGYEIVWKKELTDKINKIGLITNEDCNDHGYFVLEVDERTNIMEFRKLKSALGIRYIEPNYNIPSPVKNNYTYSDTLTAVDRKKHYVTMKRGVINIVASCNREGDPCIKVTAWDDISVRDQQDINQYLRPHLVTWETRKRNV